MTSPAQPPFRVAVACGGTGGHLYPGLAVADRLRQRGCELMLLVSPKEVDQQAVKDLEGMEIVTLPAIGLSARRWLAFGLAFGRAYRSVRRLFRTKPVQGVIAMGGFTAAAPVLAAKRCGAATFLHESNTMPGRANRLLGRLVDHAFVGFPAAAVRLRCRDVTVTGTPVRSQFKRREPQPCRRALGLDPDRPVCLVMGGSQGAHGVNELVVAGLPLLARRFADWQWLHLTGPADFEPVRNTYAAANVRAEVRPFLEEMELAMSAATVAISRAGASSLAELAAVRLPSVLVPYPAATDDHQLHNARTFVETGAALLLEQQAATPEALALLLSRLVQDPCAREDMQNALARWHTPQAAERIASSMLETMSAAAQRLGSRVKRHLEECNHAGPDQPAARTWTPGATEPALPERSSS